MKIIVFGGSGFLGSHVADSLSEAKHDVTIFDIKDSPYLRPEQKGITGNVLIQKEVRDAVKGADVVFNFAGEADITEASNEPIKAIQTNVLGNANILEACKQENVKRYIFASSIYVYSDVGSFYRATKQSCELFIESYHKHCGLDFTVLRYGSLYGPRANDSNWIHKIIKAALNDKKIIRQGDGEEIREYIHVKDAARITARMVEEEFANQYLIITGQQRMRIKDVLIMVKEILGGKIDIEYTPTQDEQHYEITPYSFQPKFARKLTEASYVDFGQGLIELLNTEYSRQSHEKYSAVERI